MKAVARDATPYTVRHLSIPGSQLSLQCYQSSLVAIQSFLSVNSCPYDQWSLKFFCFLLAFNIYAWLDSATFSSWYQRLKWSPTFPGCFDPGTWQSPVRGVSSGGQPLLVGTRHPALLVSSVPYQAGWALCCVHPYVLLSNPMCCRHWKIFHTDWAGKPSQETITRSSHSPEVCN